MAPKLYKRVQRLQDELVSRDLQLTTWRQKVAKLEEQLVMARKGETEAIEKMAMAEQRALRLRKHEMEAGRLKDEAIQLKALLNETKEVNVSCDHTDSPFATLLIIM